MTTPRGRPRKTHCKAGHDLSDPANVRLVERLGRGITERVCIQCHNDRQERFRRARDIRPMNRKKKRKTDATVV